MLHLLNAQVITPYQIKKTNVLIKNGKINMMGDQVFSEAEKIDLSNYFLAPGFIDIHLHGGGGADLMDGDVDSILKIANTHLKYGTTSIYPTTLTAKDKELFKLFKNIDLARQKNKNGAQIMGLHLEGPYLSANTKTLPIQIYYEVSDGNFGTASALSVLLFVVVFIIVYLMNHFLGNKVSSSFKLG